MKAEIAKWTVRCVSGWIGRAYYCNIRGWPHIEKLCALYARQLRKLFFPIGRKLDKEAFATQLIEEGWWG